MSILWNVKLSVHVFERTARTTLYALLKKDAKWNWTNKCQKALDTIKKMLIKPPVLVMPNLTGKFTLVSDTSKLATGAALYQEQQGVL